MPELLKDRQLGKVSFFFLFPFGCVKQQHQVVSFTVLWAYLVLRVDLVALMGPGSRQPVSWQYVVVESRFQTKKDNSHFEWAFRHSKSICGVNVFAAVLPGLGTASLGPLGLSEAYLRQYLLILTTLTFFLNRFSFNFLQVFLELFSTSQNCCVLGYPA